MAKIVETKHIFPRALDIHQELIIIYTISFIEDLCNGSTPDSDSVCGGSNPSSSAKNQQASKEACWFLLIHYSLFTILFVKAKLKTEYSRSVRYQYQAPPL